jgi:H+/Cl- antiporter ClcA
MEKIITNESRIHPLITILKPLSAAISIGTGGPFGAEGPIISTGGALGSFCGQTLHITAQERKVLLAAGATAGMTAIFGTPFAAILLAIELLLFEFSSKSFLPVMIACITGACMHFVLFTSAPTFPMPEVDTIDTYGVITYAAIGVIVGLASVVVTKAVYLIEDYFERLPIHWMWWPALGGLVVGLIGVFAPRTLGVGYSNITDALSGDLPLYVLISLCLWKFISWAIALGSGTSGGTLAPLLTIGSAVGCLLGMFAQAYIPQSNVSIPLAALVGMAALFTGASRAILTSIVFALETTKQENTLLPLIAGCSTAYLISFIMMKHTIMTEKIARRGIQLPENYRPDVLTLKTVSEVFTPMNELTVTCSPHDLIDDVLKLIDEGDYVVVMNEGKPLGAISQRNLNAHHNGRTPVGSLLNHKSPSVYSDNTLDIALELMLKANDNLVAVVDRESTHVIGVLTEWNVLKVFEARFIEDKHIKQHISIRRHAVDMLKKANAKV